MACAHRTEATPWARIAAACGAVVVSGLLAACSAAPASFSATFATPRGAHVVLDYWGERDFRLASPRGGVETWVVDGRIHLVIAPSLAFGGRGRTIVVGDLAERPARPPPPGTDAWSWSAPSPGGASGLPGVVLREVRGGPGAAPSLQVADEPRLAEAQFTIEQTLRPAMDMALCGDAVNALLAAWPAALTGRGWAAVGSPSGVALEGALRPAPARVGLPADHDLEDMRVAVD